MPDSLSADLPAPNESDWVAPDCRGQNFYDIDHAMRSLLDELSRMADRHDPVLHARDAFGRDRDWVEFHPAYREWNRSVSAISAFTACRGGAGCWDGPIPAYAATPPASRRTRH